MSRALVLGGGGVAGIAWELGVLRGLEAANIGLASGTYEIVGFPPIRIEDVRTPGDRVPRAPSPRE